MDIIDYLSRDLEAVNKLANARLVLDLEPESGLHFAELDQSGYTDQQNIQFLESGSRLDTINTLPAEILSLVFVLAQQMLEFGSLKASCFPIIISQVSRFWRSVVLGTALLWRGLYLSPPWRLNSDMIAMYLDRSGSCLIDLSVSTVSRSKRFSYLDIERLYIALIPYLPRCRSISMMGDFGTDSTVLGLLSSFSQMALPLLEHFSVELGGATFKKPFSYLVAPALKELRLCGCNLLFNVPMDGITTLHLAVRISHSRLCEALALCPALTVLAIYDNHIYDWPVPSALPSIPVNSLVSLQIYGGMEAVPELLFSLVAPNLTDLCVAPIIAEDFMALSRYLGLSTNKFPCLKGLTLAPYQPHAYKSLPLASQLFPNVEHLTLVNMYGQPFAFMLANEVDGALLFPRLSTLALSGIDRRTEALVLEMVAFRKSLGYPLNLLQLDSQSIRRMWMSLPYLKKQVVVETCDAWDIRRRGALISADLDRFVANLHHDLG